MIVELAAIQFLAFMAFVQFQWPGLSSDILVSLPSSIRTIWSCAKSSRRIFSFKPSQMEHSASTRSSLSVDFWCHLFTLGRMQRGNWRNYRKVLMSLRQVPCISLAWLYIVSSVSLHRIFMYSELWKLQ